MGRYIQPQPEAIQHTHTHTYVHIYTYTVVNSRSCQTGMHGWSVGGEIKSYFTACSSSRKQERGFDL